VSLCSRGAVQSQGKRAEYSPVSRIGAIMAPFALEPSLCRGRVQWPLRQWGRFSWLAELTALIVIARPRHLSQYGSV
jgi:hypothetical protein